MPDLTFNTPAGQTVGRELLIAYLNTGDAESPTWSPFGTSVSYYLEIGNCLFAQVVRIRSLKAKGKPLDKADREFYRENRELIDLKTQYTDKEREVVELWTKGKTAPETGTF